jgi:hypothetical protein
MGLIIALTAVYFIFPPSDSGLNIDFWKDRWSNENVKDLARLLKSIYTNSCLVDYNCWNTHFLMESNMAIIY